MVRTDKKMASGGWRRRRKAVIGADGTAVAAAVLAVEDDPPSTRERFATAADPEPVGAGGASGAQVEGGCSVAARSRRLRSCGPTGRDASVGELAVAGLTEAARVADPSQIPD
jgi:hypothetical protein